MLKTMPDMSWTVQVDRWTWRYTFTRGGGVSWKDPFNGQHGLGRWRIEKDKLVIRWNASKSWDEWDLPLWRSSSGTCHMASGSFDLSAVALNYDLQPGDSLRINDVPYIIYPDEVRSGGTVAWICRNPGAIRDGSKYGAYPGKLFHSKSAKTFAIFPSEDLGRQAIINILKVYGRVTITTAMHKYAPSTDGSNLPDVYAANVAKALGVPVTTYLTDLTDAQFEVYATAITGQEVTGKGTAYQRDDPGLPAEIKARLTPRLSPLTEEEIKNSSLLKSY